MDVKLLFWAGWLLPCATVAGEDDVCGGTDQTSLLAQLTASYDSHSRPHAKGAPVEVDLQVHLTSLTEIDQKKQTLGVAGYLREWWTDPRLAFNSTSEGGCFDTMYLSTAETAKVWQPDLYFDNVLEENNGAELLEINSSGGIWKSRRLNHVFECKMDFRRLPYDLQVCSIVIASYSEDATEVRLRDFQGDGLSLPQKRPDMTSWDIFEVRSFAELRQLSTPWMYMHLVITLKRRPDYYMRGIAFKAVLFVVISWCGFFVNRTVAPARVAIGTIPVLIMINLMNAVDAFLPPISYNTALTSFLLSCLVFTSLVVFEYALVAYLLQREIWFQEKGQILMKIGTSYLKKGDTQQEVKQPVDPDPDADRPDKATSSPSPNVSSRFFVSVGSSRNGNSETAVPSRIFDAHPVITEIFKEFDQFVNGRYSVQEFRSALRGFGQYRSPREVREIFEKLGAKDGEDLSLEQFEVFLGDPSEYLPVSPTRRSYWDLPRSLQLDIFMRFAYPFAFGVTTAILAASLA